MLPDAVGHGKKKKKWQQGEPEEEAGPVVPAGPKKEVPKPYMADAKFVTSEFRTTGRTLVSLSSNTHVVIGPQVSHDLGTKAQLGCCFVDPQAAARAFPGGGRSCMSALLEGSLLCLSRWEQILHAFLRRRQPPLPFQQSVFG